MNVCLLVSVCECERMGSSAELGCVNAPVFIYGRINMGVYCDNVYIYLCVMSDCMCDLCICVCQFV